MPVQRRLGRWGHYYSIDDPGGAPIDKACPQCGKPLNGDTVYNRKPITSEGAQLYSHQCQTVILAKAEDGQLIHFWNAQHPEEPEIDYCPGCGKRLHWRDDWGPAPDDWMTERAATEPKAANEPKPGLKRRSTPLASFLRLLATLCDGDSEAYSDPKTRKAYEYKQEQPEDPGPMPDSEVWGDFLGGLDMTGLGNNGKR